MFQNCTRHANSYCERVAHSYTSQEAGIFPTSQQTISAPARHNNQSTLSRPNHADESRRPATRTCTQLHASLSATSTQSLGYKYTVSRLHVHSLSATCTQPLGYMYTASPLHVHNLSAIPPVSRLQAIHRYKRDIHSQLQRMFKLFSLLNHRRSSICTLQWTHCK